MKQKKIYLQLDQEERSLVLQSLVDMKNRFIRDGRYTDCIDDVILKVIHTPVKRWG